MGRSISRMSSEVLAKRLAAIPAEIIAKVQPAIRKSVEEVAADAATCHPTRTEILGHAAGGQIVAQVAQMVHVWAMQDGNGMVEAGPDGRAPSLFEA